MTNRFPILVDDATPQAAPVLTPGTVVPDALNPGYHKILAAGAPPTGAAGGELTGTYPNPLVGTVADLQFNTAVPGSIGVGQVRYNPTEGTLEWGLKGGNVNLQAGQENVFPCTNRDVVPLVDGDVVYISGSSGIHNEVKRASATTATLADRTIGVVTEPIAVNGDGYVTTFGKVRDIDTNHLTEGAPVWLDTVMGKTTSAQPIAPLHSVLIGYCVKKAGGSGSIFVHVDVGQELGDLHDVTITGAANWDILRYNNATSQWEDIPSRDLEYSPAVWDDFTIPATAIANAPGTTPPAFSASEGSLAWTNLNSRDIIVNMEPGHRYEEGSTVTLHWHGNNSTNGAGNIQLVISHRIRTIGTAVPAWTVDAAALFPSGSTTDDQIYDIKTLAAPTATIGSVFQFKIQRLINAADTYAGTFNMTSIGLHFKVNTAGSNTATAK